MKNLILLLLLSPVFANAQERLSRAYVGVILHDFEESKLGGSAVYSFGINKYIGVGPGVDVIGYGDKLMIPLYADVRLKYPIKKFAPFIFGQIGPDFYNSEVKTVDGRRYGPGVKGKYFFGGGIGLSYMVKGVGGFIHFTQRSYKFKIDDIVSLSKYDKDESIGMVTIGVIF